MSYYGTRLLLRNRIGDMMEMYLESSRPVFDIKDVGSSYHTILIP